MLTIRPHNDASDDVKIMADKLQDDLSDDPDIKKYFSYDSRPINLLLHEPGHIVRHTSDDPNTMLFYYWPKNSYISNKNRVKSEVLTRKLWHIHDLLEGEVWKGNKKASYLLNFIRPINYVSTWPNRVGGAPTVHEEEDTPLEDKINREDLTRDSSNPNIQKHIKDTILEFLTRLDDYFKPQKLSINTYSNIYAARRARVISTNY
jgi:hypothetical protein